MPCSFDIGSSASQEKMDAFGPNGRIHIQVRYLPFVPPDIQAEAMKKLEKERLKANAKNQLRRRATTSTLDMRGVLTVHVHRCINLEVNPSPAAWSQSNRHTVHPSRAGLTRHKLIICICMNCLRASSLHQSQTPVLSKAKHWVCWLECPQAADAGQSTMRAKPITG